MKVAGVVDSEVVVYAVVEPADLDRWAKARDLDYVVQIDEVQELASTVRMISIGDEVSLKSDPTAKDGFLVKPAAVDKVNKSEKSQAVTGE
jgi:hypothetical protein